MLNPPMAFLKIASGVRKATDKRPIELERINLMISEIVENLQAKFGDEVPSSAIGEEIMAKLQAVDQILAEIQPALSRALDFGVFHEINPTGGAVVAAMNGGLTDTTNLVEYVAADKPYVSLDAADALVLADGFMPRDIAMAPAFAAKFSALRGTNSEMKLYPNLAFGLGVSELDGHRAVVSNTVSAAGVIAVDTKVLAFVGDFSTIRWGVQKSINLEVIEFGDPDGGGDLKRTNEVAFRSEVVYGWGIANIGAFAVITDPSSS